MNLNVYIISFACFFCCHGWIFLITSKSCHGEDEEVQQRWGFLLACIYCNPLLRLRMTRVWWIAYDSCTTTYDLACSSAFCVVFYLNGSKAIPGLISWRQVFFHLQKQRSHPNMQLGLTSTEHLRIIIKTSYIVASLMVGCQPWLQGHAAKHQVLHCLRHLESLGLAIDMQPIHHVFIRLIFLGWRL